MKKAYPIKACPWCHVTGSFHMNTDEKTWLPKIYCKNKDCRVQPHTKYVPIRKSQRFNPKIIQMKIEKVIDFWNMGSLGFNNEGFVLDFDKIVEDYKNEKLGLPGYRDGS